MKKEPLSFPGVTIPEDIIRCKKQKNTIRIIVFLVLMCAIVLFLIFFKGVYSWWKPLNIVLTIIAAVAVVCFSTGVPFKFKDKSWYGKVEAVKINTYTESNFKAHPVWESLYITNRITLTVAPDDRIKDRFSSIVWVQPYQCHIPEDYYKVGDDICFVDGTKFVCRIPSNKTDMLKCVVCGLENRQEDNMCAICGHGLIKKANMEPTINKSRGK